jgi:hypothetical protein
MLSSMHVSILRVAHCRDLGSTPTRRACSSTGVSPCGGEGFILAIIVLRFS